VFASLWSSITLPLPTTLRTRSPHRVPAPTGALLIAFVEIQRRIEFSLAGLIGASAVPRVRKRALPAPGSPRTEDSYLTSIFHADVLFTSQVRPAGHAQFESESYCVGCPRSGGGVVTATSLRTQPSALHSRYSSPSSPAPAGHRHGRRRIEHHRRKDRAFACSARACHLWRGRPLIRDRLPSRQAIFSDLGAEAA
jgi:hypothetical protein